MFSSESVYLLYVSYVFKDNTPFPLTQQSRTASCAIDLSYAPPALLAIRSCEDLAAGADLAPYDLQACVSP